MKSKLVSLLYFFLLAGCALADAPAPSVQEIGFFRLPASAPEGLSGITWMGGDTFAAVEDSGGRIHALKIHSDETTGAITNCVFTGTRTVAALQDAEGIAYDESANCLYVSDESGPKILKISRNADTAPATVPCPEILRNIRPNKSLEALSFGTDANGKDILWTANEDALSCDGPVSSTNTEAVVRLFATDPCNEKAPVREWKYKLDKAEGDGLSFGNRTIFTPFNGLAALAALGDGKLLALERICGQKKVDDGASVKTTLITVRIYFIDTAELPPGSDAPLAKTLLCTLHSGISNYEGMTLGPALPDGSRLLILVADGDTTTVSLNNMNFAFSWEKSLFSLKLSPSR